MLVITDHHLAEHGGDDEHEQGERADQIVGLGPVVGLRAGHQQREGDPWGRRRTQAGAAAAVLWLRWRGGKVVVLGRTALLEV